MRPVRRLILLHFLKHPRVIFGPVRCASSSSTNQLNKNKPTPDTRIQPKSALFVSGPSAQLAKFVVDPHLDFDGVFERIDQSHAHLQARKRPQNITPLKKAWLELRELWKKRDEIDAKQHALAAAYREVEKTPEQRQEIRQLREELKPLNARIQTLQEEALFDLLKLPNVLHEKAPCSGEDEVIFERPPPVKADRNLSAEPLWEKYVDFTDDAPRGYFLRGDLAELELRLIFHIQNHLTSRGFATVSGPHLYKAVVPEGLGVDLQSINQPEAFILKSHDGHDSPYRGLFLASSPLENFAGYLINSETNESVLPLRFQSSGRIYHPGLNRSINQATGRSINQSLDQSINQATGRSINQALDQSINQATADSPSKRDRLFYPSQTHCISFCTAFADTSQTGNLFDGLVADIREFYTKLAVPFRIVNKDAEALANAESLRFDVEIWIPSAGRHIPCGYVALNGDFVSKRLRCHAGKREDCRFLSLIHGALMNLTPFVIGCMENFAEQNPSAWLWPEVPLLHMDN